MTYKIIVEYTNKPGGRYVTDGPFSGEDFRKKCLHKLIKEYRKNNQKILLDFDGGYGYGNSFLEESFGGLVRDGIKEKEILQAFEFKSEEEPSLIEKVNRYIKEATKWKGK